MDPDALRRIETEIVTIGHIIKTQFGEGSSRGDLSHRSMSEDAARIAQLEVEKKDLETKLKLAREAMNEYITRLNDKVGTCCTFITTLTLTVNFPLHHLLGLIYIQFLFTILVKRVSLMGNIFPRRSLGSGPTYKHCIFHATFHERTVN